MKIDKKLYEKLKKEANAAGIHCCENCEIFNFYEDINSSCQSCGMRDRREELREDLEMK